MILLVVLCSFVWGRCWLMLCVSFSRSWGSFISSSSVIIPSGQFGLSLFSWNVICICVALYSMYPEYVVCVFW